MDTGGGCSPRQRRADYRLAARDESTRETAACLGSKAPLASAQSGEAFCEVGDLRVEYDRRRIRRPVRSVARQEIPMDRRGQPQAVQEARKRERVEETREQD